MNNFAFEHIAGMNTPEKPLYKVGQFEAVIFGESFDRYRLAVNLCLGLFIIRPVSNGDVLQSNRYKLLYVGLLGVVGSACPFSHA